MKYYISKPASHKLNENIVKGIVEIDADAVFVGNLYDADVCVMQSGWTKSKICVADYHLARDRHIKREESYIYTDRYTATTNSSTD